MVEIERLQSISALSRQAVYSLPKLKLSFLSCVCNEDDIFSVPHKSPETDSNCFKNALKIKCILFYSVFQSGMQTGHLGIYEQVLHQHFWYIDNFQNR